MTLVVAYCEELDKRITAPDQSRDFTALRAAIDPITMSTTIRSAVANEVSHGIMLGSPVPGTEMFEKLRVNPHIWQFSFHAVPDIPEM